MEMHNKLLLLFICTFTSLTLSAQFYTVTQGQEMFVQTINETVFTVENTQDTTACLSKALSPDSVTSKAEEKHEDAPIVQKSNGKVFLEKHQGDKGGNEAAHTEGERELPELTIPNVYAEIKRKGILYPDIVLAQAILETGWFRSSACRKKNNLFGLTNPRTGKYFAFDLWTDSVKAYYSMVQRKYDGGNYLLWLKKIGYAEDKNYIRAVIKVLKMLS